MKNKYPQTVKCCGEIMLKKLKTWPKIEREFKVWLANCQTWDRAEQLVA
jgi:hypothetical protein